MKTVICNSLQSFWDMADNNMLDGLHVHCVFPVTETVHTMIKRYQQRYRIAMISFSPQVAYRP
ncbi:MULTISPECIES: hypothetical protein [unclassified Vibrio]|uniref:Exonuclease V subunit gamma n=1 Tax=Vibrio sp. HB236076 TaxID=3232307 RepID=A0AB39HI53_9VIBR|nr:hypothetical protein [Vibrio sp. HB161653]MDP5254904.1 hypothetical protein [Vibrio sp. HB161653]